MYEDWSAERITDYNFDMLLKKYQTEQQELEEEIARLKAAIAAEQQTATDAENWVKLIRQYANPAELTSELLNSLIERIVIHDSFKDDDGYMHQAIEMYSRFIGKIYYRSAFYTVISLTMGRGRMLWSPKHPPTPSRKAATCCGGAVLLRGCGGAACGAGEDRFFCSVW